MRRESKNIKVVLKVGGTGLDARLPARVAEIDIEQPIWNQRCSNKGSRCVAVTAANCDRRATANIGEKASPA